MPGKCHPAYDDPRKVLQSRVFHAFAFIVLHKAVHGHDVSDHVIALTLYLLEMALSIDTPTEEPSQVRYPILVLHTGVIKLATCYQYVTVDRFVRLLVVEDNML